MIEISIRPQPAAEPDRGNHADKLGRGNHACWRYIEAARSSTPT